MKKKTLLNKISSPSDFNVDLKFHNITIVLNINISITIQASTSMPMTSSIGTNRFSWDTSDGTAPCNSRPHSWDKTDTAPQEDNRKTSQSNLEDIDNKLNHLAK